MNMDNYSATESDSEKESESSEEEVEDADTRRATTAARKARNERRARKFAKFRNFNVPEVYRSMAESGHKTDQKYILGHSRNWRSMWGTALHILGKKQYLLPKNEASAGVPKSRLCSGQ